MGDKKLFYWSLAGITAIFALAAIWHYGYVWMPGKLSAVLFPVNESPWEHVKIFFFPAIIIYTAIYLIKGKNYRNFIFGHSLALLITPATMLGLYYVYRTILGVNNYLPLDILICFLSIFAGTMLAFLITKIKKNLNVWNYMAIVIVLVMFSIYALTTYYPPRVPVFKDPITNDYGIINGNGHY